MKSIKYDQNALDRINEIIDTTVTSPITTLETLLVLNNLVEELNSFKLKNNYSGLIFFVKSKF